MNKCLINYVNNIICYIKKNMALVRSNTCTVKTTLFKSNIYKLIIQDSYDHRIF